MKDKKRLYLDIHAIQNLPPSNINRDDTGTPKSAQYGGVRRARVSSQSWKRAIRDYFYNNSTRYDYGIRSLNVVDYLAKQIVKVNPEVNFEEALKLANDTFNKAGVSTTKDMKVKALFFLGSSQAEELARAALDGNKEKEELKKILQSNPSIDIALFGRMVADDPSLNEDASCQIAHSISTHAVQTEFDFYTALDDLAPEDNVGAGMLGTIEYNSSTLYRYCNVAIHEFIRQIGSHDEALKALNLFIEAFSNSLPTGKINSFANQTVPQALVVSLRDDRPVSLVSAFETPINSKTGYIEESIKRLNKEYESIQKFVSEPIFTLSLGEGVIGEDNDSLNSLVKEFYSRTSSYIDDNWG